MATIFKQSAMFLCLISLIFQGCATRCPVADLDDDYFEAAQALDCVAQSVEEFGTVSISAPYIIRPSEKFSFDLNKDADYFFDHRGVQGSVMLSQQKAVDLQVSLSVQLEELSAALQALKTAQGASNVADKLAKVKKTLGSIDIIEDMFTAEGLAATLAATQGDYAPLIALAQQVVEKADEAEEEAEEEAGEDTDGDAEDADADDDDPEESPVTSGGQLFDREMRTALNTLSSKTFTPPLAGYQGDINLSPGEKLTLAASDKNRMDVLRWLAHPDEAELGDNKIAYLCMLNVSCYPGWRTRKGYAAEVMVDVKYGKEKNIITKPENCIVKISKEKSKPTKEVSDAAKETEKTVISEEHKAAELIERLSKEGLIRDSQGKTISKEYLLANNDFFNIMSTGNPGWSGSGSSNTLEVAEAKEQNEDKLLVTPETDDNATATTGSCADSAARKSGSQTGSSSKEIHPLVAGVYPMLDAQVIDVQSSFRSQKSFAMKLMAMGYGVVGESFLDAVERIERDSRSRSTVTMGSAFSRNGCSFGFRVEPRFVALENLTGKKARPDYQLQSATFPAMVLLVCDKEDIAKEKNGTGEFRSFEELKFDISTRWVPINKKTNDKDRLSELEYILRAKHMDVAKTIVQSCTDNNYCSQEIDRRINSLKDAALGETVFQELPEIKPARYAENIYVEPRLGWMDAASLFLIQLDDHIQVLVEGVSIGGVSCEFEQYGKSLVACCDAWEDKNNNRNIPVVVATDRGILYAGEVDFIYTKEEEEEAQENTAQDPPEPHAAESEVILERDEAGNIIRLELTGPYHDDAMELLNAVAEKVAPVTPAAPQKRDNSNQNAQTPEAKPQHQTPAQTPTQKPTPTQEQTAP